METSAAEESRWAHRHRQTAVWDADLETFGTLRFATASEQAPLYPRGGVEQRALPRGEGWSSALLYVAQMLTGLRKTRFISLARGRVRSAGSRTLLYPSPLFPGVEDPSAIFGRSQDDQPGSAVVCALEGTRPLLLEIQALVSPSDLAMPRRVATGVDPKRLSMIGAVLGRHAGVALGQADVFVNVAGGVRIDEPAADLGIALAIASAARAVKVRDGLACFGEIGLTGRLRPASQAERRLAECAKLGFSAAIVPEGTEPHGKMRLTAAETLRQAIQAGLDAGGSSD